MNWQIWNHSFFWQMSPVSAEVSSMKEGTLLQGEVVCESMWSWLMNVCCEMEHVYSLEQNRWMSLSQPALNDMKHNNKTTNNFALYFGLLLVDEASCFLSLWSFPCVRNQNENTRLCVIISSFLAMPRCTQLIQGCPTAAKEQPDKCHNLEPPKLPGYSDETDLQQKSAPHFYPDGIFLAELVDVCSPEEHEEDSNDT